MFYYFLSSVLWRITVFCLEFMEEVRSDMHIKEIINYKNKLSDFLQGKGDGKLKIYFGVVAGPIANAS